MDKTKKRILLPLIIFAVQWVIFGVWQQFILPQLPMGILITLTDSVVIKGIIWAAPFVLILCLMKKHDRAEPLFKGPFPWFECVIFLCLTTAFLYTVRIINGRVNTHVVFDPMFLVFSLSAGVFEELGFRGGIYNIMEPAVGAPWAAIINGVLFTLYHYTGLMFGGSISMLISWRSLLIFVMGVLFCLMFRKWRNIALNMTVHTVWDVLSFVFCVAG